MFVPQPDESEPGETERDWILLDEYPDYDITDTEPFQIRYNKDGKIKLRQFYQNVKNRYLYVSLPRAVALHRVIAKQFIPNPNPLSLRVIDHRDHNRTNTTGNNLRWVTPTTNACNKTIVKGVAQHFIDNLPEGCKPFTSYQVHPEKEMKDGTMQPAEVRKLPNFFAKWICTTDEKGAEKWTVENCYSYDSLSQYRILNPCKKAPKSVHYRDANRKVTSIAASKIQQPAEKPEEAHTEKPKEMEMTSAGKAPKLPEVD
jgi:hypothetical protein